MFVTAYQLTVDHPDCFTRPARVMLTRSSPGVGLRADPAFAAGLLRTISVLRQIALGAAGIDRRSRTQ